MRGRDPDDAAFVARITPAAPISARFDQYVRVEAGIRPHVSIGIEGTALVEAKGTRQALTGSSAADGPRLAAALDGHLLREARITADGTLTLLLDRGLITVAPDADYESWSLHEDDGSLWIGLPGGGVG